MVHTDRIREDLCRDFLIDPDRVVVVEHGIDQLLPDTTDARQKMRKKLSINPTARVALFFGGIARYKGVDILLRAFESSDCNAVDRLIVAGKCRDPSLALELSATIEAHSRCNAILWKEGFIHENEVAPLFHAADVLVMPYRHIDQSGVLFMALATGLPIVATDVGTLRNYIPKQLGAVAPVEDPEALAACIKEVLTSGAGRRVDYGAEQYLWQRTVRPMLPFYVRN